MTKQRKREKISITKLIKLFPDNNKAKEWFESIRWMNGIECPHCKSKRISQHTKPMPYRCKDCRRFFSVKTNTLMQSSNLNYQTWAIAIYFLTTNLKGIASTRLASELGITQKSAWHLAMRIRETYGDNKKLCDIVEADESFFGGKISNRPLSKRGKPTAGIVGKQAIWGAKQRGGNIKAIPIQTTGARAIQRQVRENVEKGSVLYTDQNPSYKRLRDEYKHDFVNHSIGEYVRGQAHTNGIESFWSMLKRGYYGTHHHFSHKHIARYINEFAGRHNTRKHDTAIQMALIAHNLIGRTLPYKNLICNNV